MDLNISLIDALIVIAYLAGVMVFGLWMGRGQHTLADYFLGSRSLPWWALLLSIVATETSTVTFLSLPGIAAAPGGDLTFLQITIGYIAGRLLIIRFLLPLYFRGQNFTAYQVLESRFGRLSRRAASSLFLVTRNVSDALRLFLTALVLQIVLGLDLSVSVVLLGLITIAYTLMGGARSVIWNDCLQFVVYMVGALAAWMIIVDRVPGGMTAVTEFARESGRLRLFDFEFSLLKPTMTFWAGLVGGAFLTAATHGTDQLMVQRYLSGRNQRDAAKALAASGFIVAGQFAVFLLIGVALAAFYALSPAMAGLDAPAGDRLFATFIVDEMPAGLAGITLASVFAAAMSTLSSSLNSSATALVNDVWLPLRREPLDAAGQLRAGRLATALFGVVQVGIALAFGALDFSESVVANVLKVAGFASGPVLGVYLLGVFAHGVRQPAAIAGFVVGVLILSVLAFGTALYWPWYAAAGALVTLAAGMAAQKVMR
ncbi:sodium/solute symporter [Marinihelvus fidelis]|uniref:Sodium/solute symporter n=1 Tax=Marinihelvus fidelis TaxID=2613842 RepID=A0A5N0THL3_9GAMM|nr:sodium:solute symporter [Marinihelvus fidelis]KAA9132799.1 sodium/solute symporter [Marinihelvus fidelis]